MGQISVKPLIIALTLLGCTSATPGPQAVAPQPPVWVIADGDTEITLFATVHALPEGLDWLSPEAARRLAAADTLILETIIPEDRMAFSQMLMQLGTSATLPPLVQRLPPDTLTALRSATEQLGVPISSFEAVQPWLIAITVGEALLGKIGIASTNGVEPALLARAPAKVEGFETPEQQIGFFANLSQADQIAMLDTTLAEAETAKADVTRLISLWQRGEVDAIAEEFAAEASATPALREALLAARNRRWADQLKERMAQPGKVFVAVGAAHFGGPDGLLALLEAHSLAASSNFKLSSGAAK